MKNLLAKPKQRAGTARLVTEFANGKGELCIARDCDHCAGKMPNCPKCKGVGVLVQRRKSG